MLELQIAMLILGLALVGIFPLVVSYSRTLSLLESRSPSVGEWYLVPPANCWAQKLGAGTTLSAVDPGPKPSPPVTVIDDGDDGYVETGNWTLESEATAFQNDLRRHPPPDGTPPSESDFVEWTFTNIAPGWYRFLATWTAAENNAADARFTLYDGDTSLSDVYVDQRSAPAGFTYDGHAWQRLATLFIRSGAAKMRLYGEATEGDVIADAVRLAPVENNVQVLALDNQLGEEDATVRVSVEQLVPE